MSGEEKRAGGQSVAAALDFFGDLTTGAAGHREREEQDMAQPSKEEDRKPPGKRKRRKSKCAIISGDVYKI